MSTPASTWAYRVEAVTLDELSDALDIAGIVCDGLTEESGVASAWFSTRPAATLPLGGRWEEVPTADWVQRWREGLEPITVGAITVLPPWLAPDGPVLDPAGTVLVIEPGMAFGTGHHETTTGCLAALQTMDLIGRRVADIGTGTGILTLAAVALGAAQVEAVDVDPSAVEVAAENLRAHGLLGEDRRVRLQVGSCADVGPPADVVVANIITDLLLDMAGDLAALLAPGGELLCSGVATGRAEEAVAVFAEAGVTVQATLGREWAVLRGGRRSG